MAGMASAKCNWEEVHTLWAEFVGGCLNTEEVISQVVGQQHRGRRHKLRGQLARMRQAVLELEAQLQAMQHGLCCCGSRHVYAKVVEAAELG